MINQNGSDLMIDVDKEAQKVRDATFGIETRKPISDVLESVQSEYAAKGIETVVINTTFCDFSQSLISGEDHRLNINPPHS